uniref:ATP synthase F0 subunit 8 n=1 Tax=Sinomantis denticulata TaxID=2033305 RepID=UPI001C326149|nr:ATP synthase F0 subunit 8 [Sinomantis denticulata]ASY98142.1 ATP synthase F0 subunit 8 [Sinomantis denticulata]UQJ77596.1 ATP synthase F0 subunit 8 [Sinomantis denticulata]
MPQMMPLSWLTLFFFFSFMFITFNVMNYYTPYKLPTLKTSIKTLSKTLNWKW